MIKKLKAIIVDDEQDAVNFINSIIGEYCSSLDVVGKANNVIQGVAAIKEHDPDLVFLDVEMPNGTGFDLLASFPEKDFDVIFITAFNHYAIKAIKFSAVDYILKPINITEFIEADRSYSWFFVTGNRKILVSKHLKEFQDLLSDRYFFRSHNSHLINLKYVRKYIRKEGGYIEMQD